MNENLKNALVGLRNAFADVLDACGDETEFNSNYPFDKEFISMVQAVSTWVDSETK